MKIKQALTLSLFTLIFTLGLHGQEEKLSSHDVPEAVRTAFAKAYPTAKARSWDKEIHDGTVVYSVYQINRNIMYTVDGTVVQIEETMPVADVPASISGAVTTQYPKAVIQSAERLTHGDTVEYVLKLKGAPVKTAVIDKGGKIVRTK
jgi:hypothetical protein